MTVSSFNRGWEFHRKTSVFLERRGTGDPWVPVTLPHDAMIAGTRSPEDGNANAFYPPGIFEYRKSFPVPDDWSNRRVTLIFEGVYRDAMVYVNGDHAGQRPYGYSEFRVALDPFLSYGVENTIRVEARTTGQDSRWYSGAGIYRNVRIAVQNLVHLSLEGVLVTTPEIDDELAVVVVDTVVENESLRTSTLTLVTELVDAGGTVVATDRSPVTSRAGTAARLRRRLYVPAPLRWSVDDPHLYTCRSRLVDDGVEVDIAEERFGIRSLRLDPMHGLRINNETVKLRGTCIHHDNGPIGAATIDRADERRIEMLKAAGFNAIRSAHNPASRALLDACDRLGMLVMDEAFDMWTETKMDQDYALDFPVWWEADVEAMVVKDRNRPSVVMYSIGNEIQEVGSPLGAARGREITAKLHELDPTRYVTNGVNFLPAVRRDFTALVAAAGAQPKSLSVDIENTGVNTVMSDWRERLQALFTAPRVGEITEETFAHLDVAGYNYLEARYEIDRDVFPSRLIVGSETHTPGIDRNWALVVANPHVLGDFCWTGWDYLGESGGGRVEYDDGQEQGGMSALYPWLTAVMGDIDITGQRRPPSYYREIVFGLRTDPYIAVQRPERHDSTIAYSGPWSWSDTISSWSWPGHESHPVRVEVYSASDEVELLVNGTRVGRLSAGPANRYTAIFETFYEPGTLAVVAYTDGREVGRHEIHTAGDDVLLEAVVDRTTIRSDDTDLAFIDIALVDPRGIVHNTKDRPVTVDIDGPGVLQGFGTGDPKPLESYTDSERTTFDGRALAVIRPTGSGRITITASADDCDPVEVTIEAAPTETER